MKFAKKGNKIILKNEVPVILKKRIGNLLTQLLKDYDISSSHNGGLLCFKEIFKSNLYVLLDNQYYQHTKKLRRKK